MKNLMQKSIVAFFAISVLISCQSKKYIIQVGDETVEAIAPPLVSHIYTADPSAHIFNGQLYIYPSHDIDAGVTSTGDGAQFAMRDYHVFSMSDVGGEVTDHGVALDIDDVPWAHRQMWAPDAAESDGKYYLYFPVKDHSDIFRIGVASSDRPEGPFVAESREIDGTYSMDPSVFEDGDGSYYLYFGGIWGGQLEKWDDGVFSWDTPDPAPTDDAVAPRIAKLNADMTSLAEVPQEIKILDENGEAIKAGDNARRFFEAAWVHKYNGKYYLSYSTGDTHNICYAIGDSPYGPFIYKGIVLEPVIGWTNHHSIVNYKGQWYIFYHDSTLSGGQTHLRNIKMSPLKHNADGTIQTISPYLNR